MVTTFKLLASHFRFFFQLSFLFYVTALGFLKTSICVLFSLLGIGFTSGQVLIVDALTLQDVAPVFHYARNSITHLSFSHDSSYMATAVSKRWLL